MVTKRKAAQTQEDIKTLKVKEEKKKRKIYVQRLLDGKHFAEAVLIGGTPAFLVHQEVPISPTEGHTVISTTDRIELEDRIVLPFPSQGYINKPYSFAIDGVDSCIEKGTAGNTRFTI